MMQRAAVVLLLAFITIPAFASGAPDADFTSHPGIRSVTINGEFLDVDVTGGEGSRVDLRVNPNGPDFLGDRLQHQEYGSHLEVWVDWPWFVPPRRGALVFTVPHGVQLKVQTISGRISARDLDGAAELKTVSGRINVEGSRGSLRAETVSGQIGLRDVAGRMEAKSVSGSIRGDGVHLDADSRFSTVSGMVELAMAGGLDSLRFDLSSVSGRILVGSIAAARGLRMGFAGPLVWAHSISGSLSFK